MKHLLSSLFLLGAICLGNPMQAQNVVFLYNGDAYGEADTMDHVLPHGVMLEVEGLAIMNNTESMMSLLYRVQFQEGADISVGGVCTAGGQCNAGESSIPFDVPAGEIYNGLSLEMIVPETVAEGATATFLVSAVSAARPESDPLGYTYLRIRCGSNGILSASVAEPLHIYPNPTTDRCIMSTETMPENSVLRVYNSLGQMIYTTAITGSTLTLPTAQWAEGHYLCQVVSADNVIAFQQLVVAR